MTWTSTSVRKKFALLMLTSSLVACAPSSEKTEEQGNNMPRANPPQTQPPPQNSACTVTAPPTVPNLPKLNDDQKSQAIDALTGYMRMNNSLLQVYKPEEKPDLDAVEQYIVKTLQDYCAVSKNSSRSGNITDESYSLVGDACPAKNLRRTKDALESGQGFIYSTRAADDDYTLLTPELTQFLPQTAVKGQRCSSTRISMPHRSMIQQILGQSDSFVIESKYGQIRASQHVDLTLLNMAIENGDYIEIGELLKVDGMGTRFSLKFANFEALLEVKYRKENGKLASTAYLNGEPLSEGLFFLAEPVSSKKLSASALAK